MKKIMLSIYVPVDIHAEVGKKASQADQSRGDYVAGVLRDFFDKEKEKEMEKEKAKEREKSGIITVEDLPF